MKRFLCVLFFFVGMLAFAHPGRALLISSSGPPSTNSFGLPGTLPAIIAAPQHALDDVATNTGMQGFNEAQGVLTTVAHAIDAGFNPANEIPAGTLVDSHMIFLNSAGNVELIHLDVTWTFKGIILGVMSDKGGTLEAASTFELGNPLTNYTATFPGSGNAAPFPNRGMEGEGYSVSGNTITVNMHVTEPGEWIRVVTKADSGDPLPWIPLLLLED